jgi:HNH endonuclease
MGFNRAEADALLVACHRRCCVCHRFCGFKMELHHMDQGSESEDDSIENAIPLCFECHAEVQLYNDSHPRGRKFHPRNCVAIRSSGSPSARTNQRLRSQRRGLQTERSARSRRSWMRLNTILKWPTKPSQESTAAHSVTNNSFGLFTRVPSHCLRPN